MAQERTDGAVVITGASGFLGSLLAASLLVEGRRTVVAPVRPQNDLDEVLWHIGFGVESLAGEAPGWRDRLRVVAMPPVEEAGRLAGELAGTAVREVVHCAGCLDYFDDEALTAVNVGLTRQMVDLARRWDVERFTYISTAYACGYVDGEAPEALHGTPAEDPTSYTRTKREAERLVASSGLPFYILRPSIVIGTSRSGQYTGKRYGVYQLWNGMERLLCRTWLPVIHAVAPARPIHLIHQDSFQRAFLASRDRLAPGSFLHLTSRPAVAPTLRQMWDLWLRDCSRPREVIYHESVQDVPLRSIDPRQRAFLSLAWTNLDIATRPWSFATDNLEALRSDGLDFQDVTVESLEACQNRFIRESPSIQKFLLQCRNELHYRAEGAAAAEPAAAALDGA